MTEGEGSFYTTDPRKIEEQDQAAAKRKQEEAIKVLDEKKRKVGDMKVGDLVSYKYTPTEEDNQDLRDLGQKIKDTEDPSEHKALSVQYDVLFASKMGDLQQNWTIESINPGNAETMEGLEIVLVNKDGVGELKKTVSLKNLDDIKDSYTPKG